MRRPGLRSQRQRPDITPTSLCFRGERKYIHVHLASVSPWVVRCFEVRGVAEALTDQEPPNSYMSREVIRIHPRRIISWGLGADGQQSSRRSVG